MPCGDEHCDGKLVSYLQSFKVDEQLAIGNKNMTNYLPVIMLWLQIRVIGNKDFKGKRDILVIQLCLFTCM